MSDLAAYVEPLRMNAIIIRDQNAHDAG